MRYVLIPLSLPAFLLGYLYVLLFTAVYAAHQWEFDRESWTLTATWRPWITKFWKYSTTLSYGIIFQPGTNSQIKEHEAVHVRQVQDRNTLAFVLALAGFITGLATSSAPLCWFAFSIWLCGPIFQVPNFLTAVLRGGHVYRDAEHERSAYAQTDTHHVKDKSWLDTHLSKDRTW